MYKCNHRLRLAKRNELVLVLLSADRYRAVINDDLGTACSGPAVAAVNTADGKLSDFGNRASLLDMSGNNNYRYIYPFSEPNECRWEYLVKSFALMFREILHGRNIRAPVISLVLSNEYTTAEYIMFRRAIISAGYNCYGFCGISDEEKKIIFDEKGKEEKQ